MLELIVGKATKVGAGRPIIEYEEYEEKDNLPGASGIRLWADQRPHKMV